MKKVILPVTLSVLAIAGCSPSVPACSDAETVDLVKQIAGREIANQIGADVAPLLSYTVNAIRTTDTNETTGAHECAAQLAMTASNTGLTNEIPIMYTVEMLDNGEEFYVNVYGL